MRRVVGSSDDNRQTSPVLPLLSVVIVVRNEAAHIRDCLRRVVDQDYPRDRMEIVVVDGGSEDGTGKIVESFDTHGVPTRLLRNRDRGRAAGLNVGITAATGDVIARIDARTVVEPDYLRRCVRVLEESGADNVGGVQRPLATTAMQQAIGVAMTHPFGVGDAQFRLGRRSRFVDTVYPGCFRREIFDRVGLFDASAPVISEDSELNYRISRSGGRIYLDTGIIVYFRPRETLRELWRLYFRYGGARAGFVLKHRTLTWWRALAPVAFTAAVPVLAAGALFLPQVAPWLLAVVGAYVASDVAASADAARGTRSPRLFTRLLVVFPCMHLAHGLGFWRRLAQRPRVGSQWQY